MGRPWRKPLWGGPLTLEKYHHFFVDPWSTSITNDQLNHIISMHGFVKLPQNKEKIMNHLVGQMDLQPPRRSTLHSATPKARPFAVSIATAQVAADVDAIGWTECPIGSVAAFAGFGEGPPERLEPMPPPADHVLALVVRRARSKRTRGSAHPRRAASVKVEGMEEDMELEDADMEEDMEVEEADIWQPRPSPPPLWMRSPTPPPPPSSPPRPQSAVVPPAPSSPSWCHPKFEPILSSPPGFSSPQPPGIGSPPPPGFGSPPQPCWSRSTLAPLPTPPSAFVSPPPPCWHKPTLAPLPTPLLGFGLLQATLPLPQPYRGLPLPMVPPPSGPGVPPTFTYHRQPAGPPPLCRPSVPPSYPATCWGAPSVMPPQQAAWRWPHPPPRSAPPHMLQQQQRPPPPWGFMEPSAPPMPLQPVA